MGVASLTQTRTRVTHKGHMPIPKKLALSLGLSVASTRCATTMPRQMARRHVVQCTRQQQLARVCQVQRRTNASQFVPLTVLRSPIVFNWELKVAATLRAVGSMVIVNLLHLSWR